MNRIDWDRDDDDIDTGDDLRLEYRGEPYTGEIVDTLGDIVLSQKFYTNGVVDGPTREWWTDGSRKSEGFVRYGLAQGDYREWYMNGRLAKVKHFNDSGNLVRVEEWDEGGNQTRFE